MLIRFFYYYYHYYFLPGPVCAAVNIKCRHRNLKSSEELILKNKNPFVSLITSEENLKVYCVCLSIPVLILIISI